MKNKKTVILMAIIFIIPSLLFAQNSKPVGSSEIMYSTSNKMDDVNSFTKVKPAEQQFSPEKQNLLDQLDQARMSNDITRKSVLEYQLNSLDGSEKIRLVENRNVSGMAMTDSRPPYNNENDFLSTPIINAGIWSSAVQTVPANAPNAGRLWVAAAVSNIGPDTLKFYYSDNGGQSWTFGYKLWFNVNMDFTNGELDMEVVYNGTDVWLYTVAGYYDLTTTRSNSILYRINTTAQTYAAYSLDWPGNVSTNKYYNPRVTSDNSVYSTNTYVYIACVCDSSSSGSQHTIKQKFAHLTDPFTAAPLINYRQPLPNGGFYWNGSSFSIFYYYWSDIAYFRTQSNTNRIITVFNNTGNNNIYLAWSDDYGASNTGNSVLLDSYATYGTRLVFNGGLNNYSGMVVYVRQFSGNDWDPYYRNTTNGGQNWTAGYIDNSVARARSVDVIAPRGGANIFKFGYTQDSTAGTFGYYAGGSVAPFTQPSRVVITPSGADTSYGKVIAGYRNGGGDDCLALYSLHNGSSLYSSRLCQSTVGITNNKNGTPEEFSLGQNYPNPFNPVTNIRFSIPSSSFVNLIVFDITGKVVTTLVSQQLSAGNYTYDFNASDLATGVYLYKIDAGSFSDIKKMMLIK